MKRIGALLLGMLLCATPGLASAQTKNDSPFGESYARIFARPFFASAVLTVRRPAWSRTLRLGFYYHDPRRSFVRVVGPAREQGMIAMRHHGRLYVYFPRADLMLKFASSMESFPLFGSDFSADDLLASSELSSRFLARMEGAETLEGVRALRYVLTARHVTANDVAESRLWVSADERLPLRREYLTDKGEIVRELVMEERGQLPLPKLWKARTFGPRGGESELDFRLFEPNPPVNEKLFTIEGLRLWR